MLLVRPGIVDRLRLAFTVFSRGLPWSQWGRQRKASPFAWPAWQEGKPQWNLVDFEAYVREGFNLNSLIYSALAYKARSIISAPLRAYGGKADHPELLLPDHPLAKLLARPNPFQSGPEFQQINAIYLNLSGNAFILFDRPKRGAFPTAMRSLRPDRVRIIPGDGGIQGFVYVPEGKAIADGTPVLPEDMAHVKLPNPADPLEGWGFGLSPLSPVAYSADVDNDVTRFLKLFFERGTQLNTYLQFDVPMEPEQMAAARDRWQEIYGGWENWSKVAVLDQGGKAQRFGMTFEEMGFNAIDERNEARILGPFGVPPILIGSRLGLERSTYSNYQEARQAFWQDTFVPEIQLFEEEFRYYLSAEGAFPAYDFSGVPALQKDLPKLVEAAAKLWSMGVPANQAVAAVGLSIGDIPGGDIAYLPFNLLPAGGQTPKPKPADDPEGATSTDDDRKVLPLPKAGSGRMRA